MTDPLELLWPVMDAPGTIVSADQAAVWPDGCHQQLLDLDVLQEAGTADRVLCPDCHNHVEEVLALPGPQGKTRYTILCPESLRVIVSKEALRQWTVDAGRFAFLLAKTLNLTGQPKELASDRLWRLGRWRYQGVMRDMLLARGCGRADAVEFRREITAAKRPILFVALSVPAADYWIGESPPIIPLPEVAFLEDGKILLDAQQILGLVHDVDADLPRETLGTESLSLVLDQKVRSAIENQLTETQILQAYVANGLSARAAAADLTSRGHSIHHSTVSRTVKKHEELLRTGSSESIQRTRTSQRRDTPIENRDSNN